MSSWDFVWIWKLKTCSPFSPPTLHSIVTLSADTSLFLYNICIHTTTSYLRATCIYILYTKRNRKKYPVIGWQQIEYLVGGGIYGSGPTRAVHTRAPPYSYHSWMYYFGIYHTEDGCRFTGDNGPDYNK